MIPRLQSLGACLGTALLTVMAGAAATPLELAQSPLIVQSSVHPNIMILVGIVEDLNYPAQGYATSDDNVYDPTITYDSACLDKERLPTGTLLGEVDSYVDSVAPPDSSLFPGWQNTFNHLYTPAFIADGDSTRFVIVHEFWRQNSSGVGSVYQQRLLDPDAVCFLDPFRHLGQNRGDIWYRIVFNRINTLPIEPDEGQEGIPGDDWVEGNYAGWYLRTDNTTPPWTPNLVSKPGQVTRITVFRRGMMSVIDDLVADQAPVRIGLATTLRRDRPGEGHMRAVDGATIQVGLGDLFETDGDGQPHWQNLRQAIADLDVTDGYLRARGYPLLYESMLDIGGYFVKGTVDSAAEPYSFTLWPDNTSPAPEQVDFNQLFPVRNYPAVVSGGELHPNGSFPIYANQQDVPTTHLITAACQMNFVVMLDAHVSRPFEFDLDEPVDSPLVNYLQNYQNGAAEPQLHPSLEALANVITALHDIDWRPEAGMEGKQTINTYLIGTVDNIPNAVSLENLEAALAYSGGRVFQMQNLDDLSTAFASVMFDIFRQVAVGSGGAVASSRVSEENRMFASLFDSRDWSGDLKAFPLQVQTGLTDDASAALWSAADRLMERDHDQRVIVTHDGSHGVPFRWGELHENQKNDLRTGFAEVAGVSAEQLGQARLAYLRGDQTHEGAEPYQFRDRDKLLGDIVNSAPVYVGKPVRVPQPSRTAMVYVGANDGMLHAFRAEDGEEVFAYVPRSVSAPYLAGPDGQGGLYRLTRREYIQPGEHRYYVNLKPTVAEVQIDNQWRTVLIGGLGGGGRGLFALDISNPADFGTETNAAAKVLWDVQGEAGAVSGLGTLGYTFSQPTLAKLNNGRWAVIVGSGYNSEATARLFIIDLADGSLIRDIPVAAGVDSLSTPTVVDLDGDEDADRVYVGDLDGNLWAFDLADDDPSEWGVAYGPGNAPVPLFTAAHQSDSGTAVPQPITAAPAVVFHPTESTTEGNKPNLLVLFGTGRYLASNDTNDVSRQAFYAIWDKGTGGLTVQSANLVTQALQNRSFTVDGRTTEIRIFEEEQNMDWSQHSGWRLILPPGERVISFPTPRGDLVHFTTLVPANAQCEAGGKSWLMAVNMATGAAPAAALFDLDGDSDVDDDDLLTADDAAELMPVGWEFSDAAIWEPHIVNDQNTDKTILVYVTSDSRRGQQVLNDLTSPRRTAWRELQR